eukprot:Rmarinus@m.9571
MRRRGSSGRLPAARSTDTGCSLPDVAGCLCRQLPHGEVSGKAVRHLSNRTCHVVLQRHRHPRLPALCRSHPVPFPKLPDDESRLGAVAGWRDLSCALGGWPIVGP